MQEGRAWGKNTYIEKVMFGVLLLYSISIYIVLVLYKCNYLCEHFLLLLLYPFCFTNCVLLV